MFFARKHCQLPRILFWVLRTQLANSALDAIGPGEFRVEGQAAHRPSMRPPADTLLSLRAFRRPVIPVDLECTLIVAALDLGVVNVLLHGFDHFDTMLLPALKNDLAANIGSVDKLAARKQITLCQLLVSACNMRSVWCMSGCGVHIGNQMRHAERQTSVK